MEGRMERWGKSPWDLRFMICDCGSSLWPSVVSVAKTVVSSGLSVPSSDLALRRMNWTVSGPFSRIACEC